MFPASFSLSPPCRPGVPLPRCGVVAAEAARRSHGERRPCSDVVTTTSVDDRCRGEPSRPPRSCSVGALLASPPSSPPPARPTLSDLVADLQSTLREIHDQHPCLHALMDQLTAVVYLLKVVPCIQSYTVTVMQWSYIRSL